MERRQIRKRWQVTIPRDIRQRLNFYVGQLLCFDLVEDSAEGFPYVRLYLNVGAARHDEMAMQEVSARKERKRRQQRCGRKLRFSDEKVQSRNRRMAAIKAPYFMESTELQEIVSGLSVYLLSLQERLSR
jgi:bifunctional DNA-binding transcriptional regulator/antitoxin component of YhaV-PrlF toxin-antitoxin module